MEALSGQPGYQGNTNGVKQEDSIHMETKIYYKKTRAPNREIKAPKDNTRTPIYMP
jgi:hypothetical protein